jgi:hypothetical protein
MAVLEPLATKEGLQIFTDRGGIKPGDVFLKNIQTALWEMRLFVFLASPRSADSEFIKKHELSVAHERHRAGTITALPVLFAETPRGDVWGWLWDQQFAGVGSGASDDELAAKALDKATELLREERLKAIASDIVAAAMAAPARARPAASSQIVALRCDRDEHVEKFEQESAPGVLEPAIEVWITPGYEADLTDDFAKRLYVEYVWRRVDRSGEVAASQELKRLSRLGAGAGVSKVLAQIANHLLPNDTSRETPTAKKVGDLLRERAGSETVRGFRMEVKLSDKENPAVEQVETFLKAVGELGKELVSQPGEYPKLYFFVAAQIAEDRGFWTHFFELKHLRQLERLSIAHRAPGCTVRLVPLLPLVKRSHVKLWFKEHILDHDERSIEFCDTVFERSKELSMRRIHHHLEREHSQNQLNRS